MQIEEENFMAELRIIRNLCRKDNKMFTHDTWDNKTWTPMLASAMKAKTDADRRARTFLGEVQHINKSPRGEGA
jgi:hypothetical protein